MGFEERVQAEQETLPPVNPASLGWQWSLESPKVFE